MSLMRKNLVRFKLPGRWAVCYNSFGEEEMVVVDGQIENDHCYQEDLLWLQSLRHSENSDTSYELDPAGWLADLGWYPAGNPEGAYTLHVFRIPPTPADHGWPEDAPSFRSCNRHHIVAVLEHILYHISCGGDTQDMSRQRLVALQRQHDQGSLAAFLSELSS